ncbi:MAG: exodeoxyribonuclease VII large subunit [Simkania sp.]|nr:exodeoxyribonuclease VII large subunit [Simkania sp.]
MYTTLSVQELTLTIKKLLESKFTSISVRGEISNLKEQTSGHIYFTLKDKEAQISAVLFRGDAVKGLKRPIKNGDEVVAKGELSVYAPRGNYQIIVRDIEFAGLGELLLKLHELKKTLEMRGWFNSSHKKKLPKHPKIVGVITSPTGSVIQDILHVLSRRFSGFQLVLNPVKVQGEGAAQEIAKAIYEMNHFHLADVIIVGRGGGSLEDLWAFNEEIVAEAIFLSTIPVITAIGHETDTCIADFVADVRAPTPSAAAEMVMEEKTSQLQFLYTTRRALTHSVKMRISEHRAKCRGFLKHPMFETPYALLGTYFQKLDDAKEDIDNQVKNRMREQKLHLQRISQTLSALNPLTWFRQESTRFKTVQRALFLSVQQQLDRKRQRLQQLEQHLKAINPKNLLTKGYCILFRENSDSVIVSTREVEIKDRLDILLQDGKLKVERTL